MSSLVIEDAGSRGGGGSGGGGEGDAGVTGNGDISRIIFLIGSEITGRVGDGV
jgi:hypothetical protein